MLQRAQPGILVGHVGRGIERVLDGVQQVADALLAAVALTQEQAVVVLGRPSWSGSSLSACLKSLSAWPSSLRSMCTSARAFQAGA